MAIIASGDISHSKSLEYVPWDTETAVCHDTAILDSLHVHNTSVHPCLQDTDVGDSGGGDGQRESGRGSRNGTSNEETGSNTGDHSHGHSTHAQPPHGNSEIVRSAIIDLAKQSKDKAIDVIFHGQLLAMLAFLRFYACGDGITWTQVSLRAAIAAGKGQGLACSLHECILKTRLTFGAHIW
ncbi:hypothetical protein K439DRAFT_1618291 [Ramaria rubella]|nr:hypothetical protein K439DRAFT_1618291 [Ramaria rubella]